MATLYNLLLGQTIETYSYLFRSYKEETIISDPKSIKKNPNQRGEELKFYLSVTIFYSTENLYRLMQ
jgi:hypothetical protein